MNTKQLLTLGLISFAITSNVVAMEEVPAETEIQRLNRERKTAMEQRLAQQRAQEKQQQEEQERIAAQEQERIAAQEALATAAQEPDAPVVFPAEPLMAHDNNAAPAMEPVAVVSTPAKDKEEDNGPTEEQIARDRAIDAQLRIQTLDATHASIQECNESILRKHTENILAREIADKLASQASEGMMRERLERDTAALVVIAEKYPNDAAFTPIINVLNARSAQLELDLQLLAHPHDAALWDQLDTLFDQLIMENVDNAHYAQSLAAQQAAYQQARQMVFEGHQPSGQGIIDDFEAIDRAANDAEIARHIHEQLQDEARAEQMARGEAEAHRLQTQEQADQIAQGEAAARRLEEEINRGNRFAGVPAPGPNGPDNNGGPANPGTPRADLPNPRPNPSFQPSHEASADRLPSASSGLRPDAKKFDLNELLTFIKQPHVIQGAAIAAVGASLIGFVAYKLYSWFTNKAKALEQKKKNAERGKRVPVRSTRNRQARSYRSARA